MKLRNKKTGEVIDLDIANIKAQFGGISVIPEPVKLGGDEYVYHSLAELNEEWEDFAPKEPLIKDKKIRKAVRAWAEANGVGVVLYKEDNYRFYADDTEVGSMIEFEDMPEYIGLRHEHRYTIDELCGEEEE